MSTLLLQSLIAPIFPTELSYASPKIQPHPTPYIHQSPQPTRLRRTYGSSSDTTPVPDQDGLIETDLRAGGPDLCDLPCEMILLLPWRPEHAGLEWTQTFEIHAELDEICRNENLQASEIRFCGRRSIYEPNRKPILTLLVVASRSDASRATWRTVARKLLYHIKGKKMTDEPISVEIVDEKFGDSPVIHACLPTDAIFPIWKQIALEIFNTIGTRGVFTIGCFRIGSNSDRRQCPPTVLLGVDRSTRRDWRRVREKVVAVLDRYGLDDVAVAIHKDNQVTGGGDPSDDVITPNDCRINPKLGSSIGLAGMKDAHGTLGGWVELRNPKNGEWLPFALTCSHCCLPNDSGLSTGDLKAVQKWKQEGVRPAQDENKARLLPVDSPSKRDIDSAIDRLTTIIKQNESHRVYRQVEELRANDELVVPYLEKLRQRLATTIAECRRGRNEIREFAQRHPGLKLGTVFAASGLREAPSVDDPQKFSIRDWALVKVGPRRVPGNNKVTIPTDGPRGFDQLTDFGMELPEMDEPLYKMGRATGYTEGKYGNLTTCRIATRFVNGERVTFPTWEHVILRPGRVAFKASDAGSLIFDRGGLVQGMLFGGAGNGAIGYFTAAQDLLADIRHVTGVQEIRLRDVANEP
ncbi:uncharacterized protein DSM5745_04837 [Aspergillus mulundensis]|uniref:Uncharacterized protein n=1 Tax=Aspergillus mulundensis TaxID=1810919 RepID=A0A3D8S510_9EURO|nr:hypothetical protein DSM5745_04837 [Aspergillus mulundensis]RDW81280.1 hypothetical protein DSM5745_04837 [Aspergillus mulundensis]